MRFLRQEESNKKVKRMMRNTGKKRKTMRMSITLKEMKTALTRTLRTPLKNKPLLKAQNKLQTLI